MQRALMITVSDGGAAGSPRASWLFMLASRTGQVLVRNPLPEKPATSAAYEPPSQKTGQVLVRTPGRETARISAPGTGYVRRSEFRTHLRHRHLLASGKRSAFAWC